MDTAAIEQTATTRAASLPGPVFPRRRGDARKRAMDLLIAAPALVPLSFVMAAVCLALLPQGWPLMYRQRRVGRHGREFWCLKFRTMIVDSGPVLDRHLASDPAAAAEWFATQKLKDDPRVTRLGRFLRKTSLDEVPQIFNVLAGHMSFVGPRPIVQSETIHYGDHLPHYLSVLPGVTGPWQVSGRSDTTYAERVRLDVEYAGGRSLAGDVSILLRTVPAVLRARGSY